MKEKDVSQPHRDIPFSRVHPHIAARMANVIGAVQTTASIVTRNGLLTIGYVTHTDAWTIRVSICPKLLREFIDDVTTKTNSGAINKDVKIVALL